VANDPLPGRSTYRSPDAVLAEARRIAADIRRRAEREANAVRREAAEWASETRRDAERYRARVLADLEHASRVADDDVEPAEAASTHEVDSVEGIDEVEDRPAGSVIDLRSAAEARGTPMAPVTPDEAHGGPQPSAEVSPDGPAAPAATAAAEPRPASGGTYVVGHRPPPVETSLETKVHDVVRLAVRRTFNRQFP
jgi:hypothetical protein